MLSTCPSCNRPIRKGARFCGHCGADLSIRPAQNKNYEPTGGQEVNEQKKDLTKANNSKPKHTKGRRIFWYFLVLFLILVILATLSLYYWESIQSLLAQILY